MRHHKNFLLPVILPLIASGASSCIYESLDDCPAAIDFTIENDWSACPSASPEGMAYIFFPADGSVPWRFDFAGRDAGKVNMAIGEYKFLSFNDDTYNVVFRGDGAYDTYKASTAEKELPDTSKTAAREEPVRACPDMMWGCAYSYFSLAYDGVRFIPSPVVASDSAQAFSPGYVLMVRQRPLTARYTFRIEDIGNLPGVKSMSAALSGMAGSLMLASGEKCDSPSTLSLKASPTDNSTIGGTFFTFGIPEKPEAANFLSLFVVLKDGRRFSYEYDVTQQVRAAPDPMDVTLVVKGPVLEKPEVEGDTGFVVNVDGWETEIINFPNR